MTIPECPPFTEEGVDRGGNGETFCLGVTGADLDGGQGPSADGTGWRPGAMSALRSQGGPGPRTSRDPQGLATAPGPAPAGVCVGGLGGAVWGGWELGAGSRARTRAPLSPAATASPSLGGPSAGRYLLLPGRAPSRLPARPGPPWRLAAPALSSAAPASELGPKSDPRPCRSADRPLPSRTATHPPRCPLPGWPPTRCPSQSGPFWGQAAGALSPRGTASEKGVCQICPFLKRQA